MKKIFTMFAALLMAGLAMGASYGILVNGKMYFPAEYKGPDSFGEGFEEYLAHVPITSGDFFQLCDAENSAVWAVDLNAASEAGFARNGDKYTASVTGCYDFYIKLKYEADQLYIGPGANCGTGIDITTLQGGEDDINYYAIGWINGADAGEAAYDVYDDNYLFEDGKLTIDCRMGSYIAIKDHRGNYYYAEGDSEPSGSSVTLKWANGWSPCQKWAIPEGTQYIIIRSATFKGNISLELVDKATYDAYHYGSQDIDNASVTEKARKVFMNGQLRIVRGEKVFDVTGRQL